MVGTHKRNTSAMLSSPRCGARTRAGTPCRSPATKEKKRCRMHGGAKGSGAPSGNRNALKHGAYTAETLRERAELRCLIAESEELLQTLGIDDRRHREAADTQE
jgi:glucans biosynthesis protein